MLNLTTTTYNRIEVIDSDIVHIWLETSPSKKSRDSKNYQNMKPLLDNTDSELDETICFLFRDIIAIKRANNGCSIITIRGNNSVRISVKISSLVSMWLNWIKKER